MKVRIGLRVWRMRCVHMCARVCVHLFQILSRRLVFVRALVLCSTVWVVNFGWRIVVSARDSIVWEPW